MTFVVTEACIRCKYTDCVDVCPVDAFCDLISDHVQQLESHALATAAQPPSRGPSCPGWRAGRTGHDLDELAMTPVELKTALRQRRLPTDG